MKMRDAIKQAAKQARGRLDELAERMAGLGFDAREIYEELLYELLDQVPAIAGAIDASTNTGIFEEHDEQVIRFVLERIIQGAIRRSEGRQTLGDMLRRLHQKGGGMTTVPLRSGT